MLRTRRSRSSAAAALVALAMVATPSLASAASSPGSPSSPPSSSSPSSPSSPGTALSTGTVVPAAGAPGAPSYYDEARKDCVGTSTSASSKVWFTIANGELSDVYEPTVDNTNVKSMEWVVTDGSSWTDIQSRDMTYTVSADPTGMSCTITATSKTHGYSIATTYFADPTTDAVIAHAVYTGPSNLKVYARLQPLVNGNGGGGTTNAGGNSAQVYSTEGRTLAAAWSLNTKTEAINRTYAVPTYEVLSEAGGFGPTSAGYAGTASDGANALDSSHTLPSSNSASDGDVAITAQVKWGPSASANLALGFGRTLDAAAGVSQDASAADPSATLAQYLAGWARFDAGLNKPSAALTAAQQVQYYRAINVVKASEDKTFPGAIVAGLASPWGQSVPAGVDGSYNLPTYFGSYREVFARDLYESFTALLVAGDLNDARAATRFLFDRQQLQNGSMPRNSLLNGQAAPDTGGLQLDEAAYPILMAWQSGLGGDKTLYQDHIRPAAEFVVANGPKTGAERWEEQSGYSPSTIAAEIAGLTAAAAIAQRQGDTANARLFQATADDYARNIKNWTVTTVPNAQYSTSPYFIRIAPDGNPNDNSTLSLGNGAPSGVPQQQVIDAGFLELVRLGILPANDPTIENSLTVVDNTIEVQTPAGPGYYRYGTKDTSTGSVKGTDGYGDCYQPSASSCAIQGAPWPAPQPNGGGDVGTGHPWPVLSGERGEYDLAAGNSSTAQTLLQTMLNMSVGTGIEAEQVWEDPALAPSPYGSDPTTASIGFTPGQPDGSAAPLTWAEGQYVRLAADISAGKPVEQPAIVADRYVTHGAPGQTPITITSPAANTSTSASSVTVSGTTTGGATVDVQAWDPLQLGATSTTTVTAGSDGSWSVNLPIGFGTTTVTATATTGKGGSTGYAQTSVSSTALPGTPVYSVTDPTGDDNGPGTYAYPTASDFQPGAFDLTGLSVNETADQVYLTIGVKNLAPTFGNAIGAQLFDIYVHDPSAAVTSTAAAYPTRNYTIDPSQAWSERLEIQGFGSPQWVNASGVNLGTATYVASQSTNSLTVVLPRSAFGSPTSGWSFVVALTGQNGFAADQARGFAPTPQGYTFGLCSVAETQQVPESPICKADPTKVPEVMDLITSGNQDQELNPFQADGTTYRTPVITGVTIP